MLRFMMGSNEARRPAIRIVGGVTLDAIIRPDGTPLVGLLGGNALWASAGSIAAGGAPAIHGVIGAEYPADALADIEAAGIDITNIERRQGPTARVTFSYNDDGAREQPANRERVALLTPGIRDEFLDTTRDETIRFAALPDAGSLNVCVDDSNWHLGLLPVQRFTDLVAALEGASYLQADCPARFEMSPERFSELEPAFSALDVFLPSTSDFDVMAPGEDPLTITRKLHDAGAKVIVVKSGAQGAVLSEKGNMWHLPAWPDAGGGDPTGAGDVFCGAFACAVLRGDGLLRAAAFASACASLALETTYPLDVAVRGGDRVDQRAAAIEKDVKKI